MDDHEQKNPTASYAIAFDTANEVIAIGLGRLEAATREVISVAQSEIKAHRASNTQLLPTLDALLATASVEREQIACVAVGRGPGSFTGVRIAVATAKGIAAALGVGLIGLSTHDSIARYAWANGVRGRLLVAGDAMRKEIYPAYFHLKEEGAERLSSDAVVKAALFAEEASSSSSEPLQIIGDALLKYRELLEPLGSVLDEELWTPKGEGLLGTLEDAWKADQIDPLTPASHPPLSVLPIYTRLSDAEEHERARLADTSQRDLESGVQGARSVGQDHDDVTYTPLDGKRCEEVAALEHSELGSDAWSAALVHEELARKDRSWWMALHQGKLIGYVGALIGAGEMQLLKIAVDKPYQRTGVASQLLSLVAADALNLAAVRCVLEVRASNGGARAFYERRGFEEIGQRQRYYSDGESAVIMAAPLEVLVQDGLRKTSQHHGTASFSQSTPLSHPLILALETSCDETAASVIDGNGDILSDVVASQVDFHARFGGVVPEIASRKHIEAIGGVAEVALADSVGAAGGLTWRDLDAIAVTFAPGLVGALVVGVAFAKGAAWALDVPFIGVDHLEGHLYANNLAFEEEGEPFHPPAIVSLLSGGNTMLVHMKDWQDYEILGATIDDAVGEAFDKVAKALGLPYPGGPLISKLAEEGDPTSIDFPRALLHSGDYRFSLSGLKTAVITYINEQRDHGTLKVEDVCASFQQAVIDVQVSKAKRALEESGCKTFCLGGGVGANPALRQAYEAMGAQLGVRTVMPPLASCGDNAAMIALVALDRYRQQRFFGLEADAHAHRDLSKPY